MLSWTDEQFSEMSWHDCGAYGFHLCRIDEAAGTADLFLDIDYLLEWHRVGDAFEFTVCQAVLRFVGVSDLKMELDYANLSAGMCAFALDEITRKSVDLPNGLTSFRWRLNINWPEGLIEFHADGFIVDQKVKTTGFQPVSFSAKMSVLCEGSRHGVQVWQPHGVSDRVPLCVGDEVPVQDLEGGGWDASA